MYSERTLSSITTEEVAEIATAWLMQPGPTHSLDTALGAWLHRVDHGSFFWDLGDAVERDRVRSAVLATAISLPNIDGEWAPARQRAVATRIADKLLELEYDCPEYPCGRHELWFDPITGLIRRKTIGRSYVRSTPKLIAFSCDYCKLGEYLVEWQLLDETSQEDDDLDLEELYPDEARAYAETMVETIFEELIVRVV